jgi:hypothetical protein
LQDTRYNLPGKYYQFDLFKMDIEQVGSLGFPIALGERIYIGNNVLHVIQEEPRQTLAEFNLYPEHIPSGIQFSN